MEFSFHDDCDGDDDDVWIDQYDRDWLIRLDLENFH